MRPAGATLRLFAQWLRPTTIFNRSDLSLAYFFMHAAPAQARLSRDLRRTASARTPEIGWFSRPLCSPFSVCATDGGRTAPSIHAGFRPNVRLGKCFHAGDLARTDSPDGYSFTTGRTSQVIAISGR